MISKTTRSAICVAALASGFIWQTTALAVSGTWTETTGDGTWSSGANWNGGVVADGADNTADFSQVDVDAAAVNGAFPGFFRNAIQLDSPRTIGNLVFGDSNAATPGGWEVYTNDIATNLLTLAGTSPTITVNPLGPIDTATLGAATPEVIDDAIIRPSLVGTSGFTKGGAGVLSIGGTNPNLTGTIDVNQGTLRVRTGATFDFETATTAAVTRFNIANGATLESQVSLGQNAALPAAAGITVASGATATLRNTATNSQFFANVIGSGGATLNYVATTGGALTGTIDRDWSGFATVNFTGTAATPSQVRLRNNGGTFNANSFLNTTLNLSNMTVFTNTNSGGNTNFIGALSGDATSTLQGGAAGSVVTYQIGNLNSNTTFAGNITTGNGLNLFKVGTGTLELSGTLSYVPTTNATLNRRGGVTRVEVGTLKLTGPAAIPGGIDDTGTATNLGLLPTTVDVRSGATLDVSGTTNPYSTAAIQQVIGTGTIVGNYNHDEGILAPGDGVTGGNTASLIATAGTLTFANTLSFSGTGQINFDVSPSLVSGNDRIQVGGANLAGSPVLKIGFLGGAAAGQYTVVNSATPLVGTTAGWTVQWEGRGAAPALVQTANQVKLDLGAITTGNLSWRGNVDGVWNAGAAAGTANWHNTDTASSDKFFQLDNVAFRDTYDGVNAPTTTAITLNTTVSPSSVLVNSSLDYTISGTGRITGGASLTKQGTGTLTITTANDYGGGTTISGGIVNRDATGGFGAGAITLAGGELRSRAWTSPNPIAVPAASTGKIRNIGGVIAAPVGPNDSAVNNINLDGAISGSGNLEFHNDTVITDAVSLVEGPQVQAFDLRGNNSGFTGTASFEGASPVAIRFATPGAWGTNVAWDLGSNGSTLATLLPATTPTTVALGSLSGGALSPLGAATSLGGHLSSAGIGPITFEIGGLNTSTTFSGNINDGNKTGTPERPENITNLTKVGTGTLTLDGMSGAAATNLYTGTTSVIGGTLSISTAYLADGSDVLIANGALMNLNFGGDDVIDSLYLNGVPQAPGLYGAGALGSSFFTGTGQLQVTTLGPTLGVIGDYNGDNVVDAADYTTWRNALGTATVLANRDPANVGNVSQADYDSWKAHFGQTPGAGSLANTGAVPEPTGLMLLVTVVGMLAAGGSRRRAA